MTRRQRATAGDLARWLALPAVASYQRGDDPGHPNRQRRQPATENGDEQPEREGIAHG